MAGNLQNIGLNVLTFGPLVIDYGPKGTTTHFTVTCPTIAPLIAYYNYAVQFGASGKLFGCDVGSDGLTSAEVKRLEVSVPGLANQLGSVLSELFFDSWELLTNEQTDSVFNNPLIVGAGGSQAADPSLHIPGITVGSGWMTDNDKV